jgi:sortase (surface protein transpeptidase)
MAPRLLVRRTVLPVLLATVMAAGSSLAATAPEPTRPVVVEAPTAPAVVAAATSGSFEPDYARRRAAPPVPLVVAAPKPTTPATPPAKPSAKPQPKPARPAVAPKPVSHPSAPVYKGRNHLWIPALGVNRSVGWYPCGASSAPGLGVYRWGCAGRNNIYLLAHAYAAFKSLHDAYVSGRLRKGMRVIYADASGRVRTYVVMWWRLTTPDNGGFAYAAQSRPSMTLQTCVGARSQYRLVVRLVAIN